MALNRKFKLIAQKLVDDQADIRHSILDIWPEFQQATFQLESFPKYLHDEILQIRNEMAAVQPKFPSHRKTSSLFDREGMGRKGFEKANDLARRIISVYRRMEKEE